MCLKLRSIIIAAGLLGLNGEALAVPFPGKGIDTTPSLGVFRIFVEPKFAAYFNCILPGANPFWSGGSQKLTSPVLFDPNTTIQRSNPFAETDPLDVSAPCGDGGITPPDVLVGDGDMTLVPAGYEGLTPEVHTDVYSLNLQGGPDKHCGITPACSGSPVLISVRGGLGQGLPLCPGEVGSNVGSGFPASSFFDIFVEVSFGSAPDPLVFYNKTNDPLLVANNNLMAFPPHVVYIHENSTAVPVYMRNPGTVNGGCGPISWAPDELFGYLVLAGHGTDLPCGDPAACEQFYQQVTTSPEMPLPITDVMRKSWGRLKMLYR